MKQSFPSLRSRAWLLIAAGLVAVAGRVAVPVPASKGPQTESANPAAETAAPPRALDLRLPNKDGSVRFAVMGDTGSASKAQYEVGQLMADYHRVFPFEFVIMCGDNLYWGSGPDDFRRKFEMPYAALLADKVMFYASLGNHDNPSEVNYKDWHMEGKRYYTWRAGRKGLANAIKDQGVRFFALDSNYMDKPQLDWLESELHDSTSEWKIAFFHHPLYSSGRFHGSSLDLRRLLEPLFVKYDVKVVFSGHDHIYERVKPQHGVYYFVSGAGGSLRKGNIDRGSGLTEVGFDTDYHFMLVEIDGHDLHFQAISRAGQTVDSGVIHHPSPQEEPTASSPVMRQPSATQQPSAVAAARPPAPASETQPPSSVAAAKLTVSAPAPHEPSAVTAAAGGSETTSSKTAGPMDELWIEPTDIRSRDLFYGRGGKSLVPRDAAYQFVALNTRGHSDGYEVLGKDGRTWKVKVGDEAQSDVVVSRILWALGYHQPVTYFVSKWRLIGGPVEAPPAGRFRLESDHKKGGEWSWSENPFVSTRPLRGLVVVNMLLNNWDLRASQNKIYRFPEDRKGPSKWFVVQDVGGSLGKMAWPIGSRNNIGDFEHQGFIKEVKNDQVEFYNHSRHGNLLRDITPDDVAWTCRLLARLSDRQLNDAFRAADYSDEIAQRYVRKIREKIQEGLALGTQARAAP